MPALTRFAPTPSGYLHTGNACSFVLTWVWARSTGRKILLRIDDLDAERSRPEYVEDIFRTLDWLGLDYDIGPSGPDDFYRHWSQQERLPLYHELLQKLVDTGNVFPCALSRQQVKEMSSDGQYPPEGRSQGLPLSAPDVAWRLLTPEGNEETWTDVNGVLRNVDLYHTIRDTVLRRRDGVPAYQVASLADDLHYGVDLIVRGEDLLSSTAVQRYMSRLSGEPAFLQAGFIHHPLLEDAAGQKMSKSTGDMTAMPVREAATQSQILSRVAGWLGLPGDAGESLSALCEGMTTGRTS